MVPTRRVVPQIRAKALAVVKNGGDEGDRTPDLSVANAALSHLSYIPIFSPGSGTT